MKVRVKVIEEVTYELDINPEDYCHARAHLPTDYSFHDKVLTEGEVVDMSRTWQEIINLEPEKLEDFFDTKA